LKANYWERFLLGGKKMFGRGVCGFYCEGRKNLLIVESRAECWEFDPLRVGLYRGRELW